MSDIERHAEDIVRTKRRLNEIYSKHCGRTYEEVERTLDRDHFMTATEAKAWGLVDHVYSSRDADAARLDLTRQFTRHDSSTIRCSKPIADCKVPEPYVASISGAPPIELFVEFRERAVTLPALRTR